MTVLHQLLSFSTLSRDLLPPHMARNVSQIIASVSSALDEIDHENIINNYKLHIQDKNNPHNAVIDTEAMAAQFLSMLYANYRNISTDTISFEDFLVRCEDNLFVLELLRRLVLNDLGTIEHPAPSNPEYPYLTGNTIPKLVYDLPSPITKVNTLHGWDLFNDTDDGYTCDVSTGSIFTLYSSVISEDTSITLTNSISNNKLEIEHSLSGIFSIYEIIDNVKTLITSSPNPSDSLILSVDGSTSSVRWIYGDQYIDVNITLTRLEFDTLTLNSEISDHGIFNVSIYSGKLTPDQMIHIQTST